MANLFLSAENMTYRYDDGQAGLQGAKLDIRPSTRLAVLGPNGAGKSTLLLALAGLIPATFDRLIWNDCPVLTRNARDFGKHFKSALLMQDPDHQLIAPSILQDIMLGPLAAGACPIVTERKARQFIRTFGLEGQEARSPHHLSVGQKKKVALAGLLICEPQVLLLDEPTVGLDARGIHDFSRMLRTHLNPETIIVLATHDQTFVRNWANEVMIMDQGRTVDQLILENFLQNRHLMEICGFEQQFEEVGTWNQSISHPLPLR